MRSQVRPDGLPLVYVHWLLHRHRLPQRQLYDRQAPRQAGPSQLTPNKTNPRAPDGIFLRPPRPLRGAFMRRLG
jgi:hypothetical protein